MRKLVSLAVLGIMHTPCLAQTGADKVWNTIVSMDVAIVKKDSSTLQSMLTNDFVGAIPSGKSFTRTDYIRYHCKPGLGLIGLEEYPMEQASIRLHDNTAIINRRVHAKLKKPDGSVSEFDVQRIEVCYKEKGEWHIASGQGTEVNLGIRP